MAVPFFLLLLLIPCPPALAEDDSANSPFHSLFKRFSDWPLESAFVQADDDDDGGGLDKDDDGELRSRDELLHQILRDQVRLRLKLGKSDVTKSLNALNFLLRDAGSLAV